jgi:Flp pilus assembly protein TadD
VHNLQVKSVIRALFPLLFLSIGLSYACSPSMNSSDQVVRYTATLTTHPDDQTALVGRCAHYINLERYAEAVADCTWSLHLQPNGIHALQNRATAYQRWGRLPQSLADWEQALALMEQSEFWRRNSPKRIEYARIQIRSIRQQLESGS